MSVELCKYDEYRADKISLYVDSIRNQWRVFPPSLQIALTDYCFNKCITCGHWRRADKNILSLNDLLKFLEIGKNNGLETVCYSGGDPFFYREINSIMRWNVDNGIDFSFISSGFIPEGVDFSLLSKCSWIRVSLDSIENYDKCRGGSVTFDKIDRSIKKMVSDNISVGFGITIHKYNFQELDNIASYAVDNGIIEFRCWPVRHNSSLFKEVNDSILLGIKNKLDKANVENNLDSVIDIYRHGESVNFDRCYAVYYQLFVGADGSIYPCCILAGDTESDAHYSAFGKITDDWNSVHQKLDYFSKDVLLDVCRNNCIKRLSTINVFADKLWNRRSFL